jgi:hypothetical protein
MARYNTSLPNAAVNGAGTITIPQQGLFTEFTGTAPYTVTIPDPTIYGGQNQQFYNATTGSVTINTPSGIFTGASGSGSANFVMPTLSTLVLASDGTNYIVLGAGGGPISGTTLTASSTVTLSPASATVTISPTGSTGQLILSSPTANATAGTMDNVQIGSTTAQSGKFTTLSATSTVSGSGFSTYLASPPAIGATAAAAGAFTSLTAANGSTLTANGSTQINGSFTVAASQTISMGSNRITNVADPSSTADALTLNYFNNNQPKITAALFFYGTM